VGDLYLVGDLLGDFEIGALLGDDVVGNGDLEGAFVDDNVGERVGAAVGEEPDGDLVILVGTAVGREVTGAKVGTGVGLSVTGVMEGYHVNVSGLSASLFEGSRSHRSSSIIKSSIKPSSIKSSSIKFSTTLLCSNTK
jgi:hypothetical protein